MSTLDSDDSDQFSENEEKIAKAIVHNSIKIHRKLGPGLLENIYEVCLAHELTKAGFSCERQVPVPVKYDSITFDEGYRIDLFVNNLVICELKTVEKILPVHEAQLLSYMRMKKVRLGFLLNFKSSLMKIGIKRFVLNK
jgi:GxxExxY protein